MKASTRLRNIPLVLLAASSATAAVAGPMYGTSMLAKEDREDATLVGKQCVSNSSDSLFFPGNPRPFLIGVYVDPGFAAQYNAHYQGTTSDLLAQTEVHQIVQDAIEVWNRESRGPVLLFKGDGRFGLAVDILNRTAPDVQDGGDRGAVSQLTCAELESTLPQNSLFVVFDGDSDWDGDGTPDYDRATNPSGMQIGWYVGSAGALVRCTLGDGNKFRRAVLGVVGGWRSPGVPLVRTRHNLKALFVHELGHALGLSHSNAKLAGQFGAISVMSEKSTWLSFFDELQPTPGGGRRRVHDESASPDLVDGKRFFTQSAPYPEGATCLPDSQCHNPDRLPNDESGGQMQLGRINQLHLWPYDVDCTDNDLDPNVGLPYVDGRRRGVQYRFLPYDPSTASFGASSTAGLGGLRTSKGFASGGMLRSSTSGNFGVFFDSLEGDARVKLSTVDANGTVDFSGSTSISGSELEHVSIRPLLFSVYEKPQTSFNAVVLFPAVNRNDVIGSSDPNDDAALFDPPVWRQQRGTSPGDRQGFGNLRFCPLDSPSCSSTQPRLVQTHITPSVAWDPVSGKTIFAIVPTRGNCVSEDASDRLTCGRIYLHVGYSASAPEVNHTLNRPTVVDAHPLGSGGAIALPGAASMYSGRTDVAPAVACAPATAGLAHGRNCLLAWRDSGSVSGVVLYTYFSVEPGSTKVLFHSTASVLVHLRGLASWPWKEAYVPRTATDLAGASFGGRFWVGFKSSGAAEAGSPGYVSTADGHPNRWSGPRATLSNVQAVEPPTWLYDPVTQAQEAAFVFTVSE